MQEKKMMLVLYGSPHAQGATAKLLEEFLNSMNRERFHVEVFDAYQTQATPCTGCGFCAKQQACVYHDLDELDGWIRQADAIIVASPVYNLTFPSPLKAVLDRFQRYFEARFSLGLKPSIPKHKTAVLLTAQGSPDPEGASVMVKQLKMAFSVMNTTLEETVSWIGTDTPEGRDSLPQVKRRVREVSLAIQSKL